MGGHRQGRKVADGTWKNLPRLFPIGRTFQPVVPADSRGPLGVGAVAGDKPLQLHRSPGAGGGGAGDPQVVFPGASSNDPALATKLGPLGSVLLDFTSRLYGGPMARAQSGMLASASW